MGMHSLRSGCELGGVGGLLAPVTEFMVLKVFALFSVQYFAAPEGPIYFC